jgi:hypothetical protein
MSDKTWTVVGTSMKKGEKKLRLANGTAESRQKVLEKDGHVEVRLFDLPSPMTAEAAETWLRDQGDAVLERKPTEPKVAADPHERTVKRLTTELMNKIVPQDDEQPILHEELGLAASGMSPGYWKSQSRLSRQEMSRNAARKAGIACPKGTYPELDAWLRADGVETLPDGTLKERA